MKDLAGEFLVAIIEADELHEKGKYLEAAQHYMLAQQFASLARQVIRTQLSAGINFRMCGKYEDAALQLTLALENAKSLEDNAETTVYVAVIQRDLAMLDIDLGNYIDALELLKASAKSLFYKDTTELGATYDFTARAYAGLNDTRLAYSYHAEAHQLLHKNWNTYELNNLVWWMKLMKPVERIERLPRALWLAIVERNRVRAFEAIIIAFAGPKKYEQLKQRVRS